MNKSNTNRLVSSKQKVEPLKLDPSQTEYSKIMSDLIVEMPREVQDRFKALKVIYDKEREIELEEEQMYRDLEKKFEQRLADVYDEREDVLAGEFIESESVVNEYDKRSLELQDSNYFLMKVDAIDIRSLQNQGPTGVRGFWFQAMRNHPKISKIIHDNDKDCLMYLRHIETKLHTIGFGFDLIFRFDPNPYFKDSTLFKKYHMKKSAIIDEIEGCSIYWSAVKSKANLLKLALNRKLSQMGAFPESKNLSTSTETFFTFFKHKKPLSSGQAKSISVEQEDEMRDRMEIDYEIGLSFKDELIPLALEYYLGAMGTVKDDFYSQDHFGLDSTALLNYDDNMSEFDEDPKTKSKKKFEEINQLFATQASKGCTQQ